MRRLRAQGFAVAGGAIQTPDPAKNKLRRLHEAARQDKAKRELAVLAKDEPNLLAHFAEPGDLDPMAIRPEFKVVETGSDDALLYRYATLLWSVPVSQGYGRRTRFLVRDKSNGKLVGIFAAGDPVFNLRCRDQAIGWDGKAREERLYNVLDLFVLGAVPPYNQLLGGKLVAYLAASNEVRGVLEAKYGKKATIIRGERKDSRIAMMTTSSALGKSALYDRISFDHERLYERIGTTQGWGHFHLNHGLFEELQTVVERRARHKSIKHRFGDGPNWKMRTAREALEVLGLPPGLMRHGIGREVYRINVATNAAEFLRGETRDLIKRDLPLSSVVEHWKQRWLAGRVARGQELPSSTSKLVATSVRAGLRIRLPRIQTRLG